MRRRRYRTYRSEHLMLDPAHKKIGGVCAGIANYFDWSNFTVRVLAIIALFLMPHFTLPAYGIAYLILDKEGESQFDRKSERYADDLSDEIYDL